ncbi:MAG: GntR family transcriptional regulator [Chloracidobacterium sp.]|uniref:GntR family transcriptional regulator n=1 Tax=Chloracidobacterium validum TaxID=2821543 RepID=A0ABX8B7F6_9BACT|nr:GntR family transcriptional regulator [Chloracidobacterium validum]QUW02889.1 GntR family transcriptional regulator [Chloracidobacterium validum]
MRLWVAKQSEVSPREQLVTQFVFAIASQELKPGEKLPSTRELARRLGLHPNTISAVFQELARRGWVEQRHGSGVYVRSLSGSSPGQTAANLDQLFLAFLEQAWRSGHSLAAIRSRLADWLATEPPDHLLVLEPDEELRRILVHEIQQVVRCPVRGMSFDAGQSPDAYRRAVPVALYTWANVLTEQLPPGTACLWLRTRAVWREVPLDMLRAPDCLVTVASSWPDFLRLARAMCAAAGGDLLACHFQDARAPDWQTRLAGSDLVITDTLTARQAQVPVNLRTLTILADETLEELRLHTERFLAPEAR